MAGRRRRSSRAWAAAIVAWAAGTLGACGMGPLRAGGPVLACGRGPLGCTKPGSTRGSGPLGAIGHPPACGSGPLDRDYVWQGYELEDALAAANETLEDDCVVSDGDGRDQQVLPFRRDELLAPLEQVFFGR